MLCVAGLAFALVAIGSRQAGGRPEIKGPRAALNDSAATEWKVPPSADKVKNPVPSDADSVAAGKKTYEGNCTVCHGKTGKGDGPAAAYLKTRPSDLTDSKMWDRTDGNLYYKITEGRNSMPSYRLMLTDKQRWEVVNYIRTLAPKPAAK